MSKYTVVPVILCGGSGTRLWPASRENHPKQFLKLMGDFSLLQDTMRRALRISGSPAGNLVTVTLGNLSEGVREQLSNIDQEATQHILSEPCARDTAAAVAFAASYVKKHFGGHAIMWVLPADHHVGDEHAMRAAFNEAIEAAAQDYLVTFGIRPTRPETGYGYIRLGDNLKDETVYKAEAFVEKPNRETALEYLNSGMFLWNSGMFLFSAERVLNQYEKYAPEVLTGVLESMEKAPSATQLDFARYVEIEKKPFDKAIMEKSRLVAVIPCNPEWSDIGSWESLWEIRQKDEHGNVTEGQAACYESRNCFVQSKDRLIACAGVENIVVIETEDAVLIADRRNGDAMKVLVNALKKSGRREVEDIAKPARFEVAGPSKSNSGGLGVREVVVEPGHILSVEGFEGKRFVLTFTEGSVTVYTAKGQNILNAGSSLFVDAGEVYRLKNTGSVSLKFLEVVQDFIVFSSEDISGDQAHVIVKDAA